MVRYGAGALVTAAAIAWMYPLSAPAAAASVDTTTPAMAMAPPAPEPAFSFDSMPGRLPKDVVPERYEIAVTPQSRP